MFTVGRQKTMRLQNPFQFKYIEYDQEILQTNLWHRKEEPQNNHETPGRQTKESNLLSLPYQDYCKTRMEVTHS